jgi:hypothetical protein
MEDSDSSEHYNDWMPFEGDQPDSDIEESKKRKRSSKERLIQLAVVLFFILVIVALWRLK